MSSDMQLFQGDMLAVLPEMSEASLDCIVTDPPYELQFMGKRWDASGIAFQPETWKAALRVLKPGGHLLAFGGTRTHHRLWCALEDAGFEIRNTLIWLYGTGFPKGLDVSKAIDRAAGVERPVVGNLSEVTATDAARQWEGWGTALKPAWEPIVLARKPLSGTVAANVQQYGTGALNLDGCRIEGVVPKTIQGASSRIYGGGVGFAPDGYQESAPHPSGRWPANVVLDEDAAELLDAQSGGASRFFYCAKASRKERGKGNKHPTVKPVELMRWLVRLVTPPRGLILDPFIGSGSTAVAAIMEGFCCIGIDNNAEYLATAQKRVDQTISELRK